MRIAIQQVNSCIGNDRIIKAEVSAVTEEELLRVLAADVVETEDDPYERGHCNPHQPSPETETVTTSTKYTVLSLVQDGDDWGFVVRFEDLVRGIIVGVIYTDMNTAPYEVRRAK